MAESERWSDRGWEAEAGAGTGPEAGTEGGHPAGGRSHVESRDQGGGTGGPTEHDHAAVDAADTDRRSNAADGSQREEDNESEETRHDKPEGRTKARAKAKAKSGKKGRKPPQGTRRGKSKKAPPLPRGGWNTSTRPSGLKPVDKVSGLNTPYGKKAPP